MQPHERLAEMERHLSVLVREAEALGEPQLANTLIEALHETRRCHSRARPKGSRQSAASDAKDR
jgi:hypothetical protein